MRYFQSTRLLVGISWLTLVVAGVVSGDLVFDLVFEPPITTDTAGTGPASEEPDNGAEHVLMPSQSAHSRIGLSPLPWTSHIIPITFVPDSLPAQESVLSRPELSDSSASRGPTFLLALRI